MYWAFIMCQALLWALGIPQRIRSPSSWHTYIQVGKIRGKRIISEFNACYKEKKTWERGTSNLLEEQSAIQVIWSEKVSKEVILELEHASCISSLSQLGRNRHGGNIQTGNIAFIFIYPNSLYLNVTFWYFPYRFSTFLVKIGLRYLIVFVGIW